MINKNQFYCYEYIYLESRYSQTGILTCKPEVFRGGVAEVLGYDFEISEFELQSRYHIHWLTPLARLQGFGVK